MKEPNFRTCQFCENFHRNTPWRPDIRPNEGLNVNECWLYPEQTVRRVSPFAAACPRYKPHDLYIDGVKKGELYFRAPKNREVKLDPNRKETRQ